MIIYNIKLYILTPIFSFFYDILHCSTQQQQRQQQQQQQQQQQNVFYTM